MKPPKKRGHAMTQRRVPSETTRTAPADTLPIAEEPAPSNAAKTPRKRRRRFVL